MADLQTKEQKLSGLTGFTDIVDLLIEVNLVQYKTGWTSKHLAADAIREITRLRQLLSEAEKREREAKRIAVNAETYGYGHGLEAAAQLAKKMQDDALTDSAREHAGHFEESIRALQSEER